MTWLLKVCRWNPRRRRKILRLYSSTMWEVTMTDVTDRRRERRVRQANAAANPQMKPISYDLPIYELFNPSGVARVHEASMRILSEFGIDFYDEEVRAILKH